MGTFLFLNIIIIDLGKLQYLLQAQADITSTSIKSFLIEPIQLLFFEPVQFN